MKAIYGKNLKGGAVFAKIEVYKEPRMENTSFYEWGPENFEGYEDRKGVRRIICRLAGSIFHLTHPCNNNENNSHRSIEQMRTKELV